MGIFLCGPVTSVKVLLGPEIFEDGDKTELHELNKGSGFPLRSYLPRGGPAKVRSAFYIRGCGESRLPQTMATDEWPVLPPWKEKRAMMEKVDPQGVLLRGGAHMPLLGFLGYRPRRSEKAINGREKRFCVLKGNLSLKGKGPQGSGSQSSWGEEARGGKGKGKPHAAMEAWANMGATANAPSTVVEPWPRWERLIAENWSTWSTANSSDDENWGHWSTDHTIARQVALVLMNLPRHEGHEDRWSASSSTGAPPSFAPSLRPASASSMRSTVTVVAREGQP